MKICQESMWSGWEWKQVPTEYKSEVLLLETTDSVRSQVWKMSEAMTTTQLKQINCFKSYFWQIL